MSEVLLETVNLRKYFKTPKGNLHAVDDINLSIKAGKTLGVVGESGCGKSTLGRTILRLIEPTSGQILYRGEDISKYNKKKMWEMHHKMQIIFQDPYASINPRMTVSEIIADPMKVYGICKNQREMNEKVAQLMDTVGLASRFVNTYPHELDGGRRQRIGIARALAMEPKFIVCDEPVSALDVSIQAQILNLLQELKEQMGLTFIFITHDLSVVNHFADEIAVMYLGQLIEKAPTEELFDHPVHPYTRALLSAIPIPEVGIERPERILLRGEISSPIDPPDECRFAKRCNYVCDQCHKSCPQLVEISEGHFVSCHLWENFK